MKTVGYRYERNPFKNQQKLNSKISANLLDRSVTTICRILSWQCET
jgi:hypothetical protein